MLKKVEKNASCDHSQKFVTFQKILKKDHFFKKNEISLAVGDVSLLKLRWKSFNSSYTQKAIF